MLPRLYLLGGSTGLPLHCGVGFMSVPAGDQVIDTCAIFALLVGGYIPDVVSCRFPILQLKLKLHRPMTFESLHYFGVNISHRPLCVWGVRVAL